MRLSVLAIAAVVLVMPCQARLITVDDDGPADFSSIQAAIDDANDFDVVVIQPGRYAGTSNRDISFSGKVITVRSSDPNDPNVVAATVIDCQGTMLDQHRGFRFNNGEDANSVLDGLTITNGYISDFEAHGGAILCSASAPTIRRCSISGNFVSSGSGGAVYCQYNAAPLIEACSINRNHAYANGGGICVASGRTTIVDCTITENAAEFEGGGIFTSSETSIDRCVIDLNEAGGIVCDWASVVDVNQCDVSGNLPYDGSVGGGITCRGTATVTRSTIVANTARSDWFRGSSGGGITCAGGTIALSNCLIVGNRSLSGPGRFGELTPGNGGAITCSGGSVAATFCTIADNLAQEWGGGLYVEWADTTINNCIVWANAPDQANGWPPTVSYSDVKSGWTELGNIDADPQFVAEGYWHDNGTPEDANDDSWTDGDYHLKSQAGRWNPMDKDWLQDASTSPCIDAANPGCPPATEPLPNGNRANMGAYGRTPQASLSPDSWRNRADLDNDLTINLSDLSIFAAYWLETDTCIPGDLDHNGSLDLNDFAIMAAGWTGQ